MSEKNFSGQEVRQRAERADRDLFSFEIFPGFNLRGDNEAVQEKLFADIDDFPFDIARHHRIEGAW